MYSLIRRASYETLKKCQLSGSVIDLGGGHDSEYHKLIQGNFTVFTMDIDPAKKPDVVTDFEQPLSVADEQYDGAIMMNILEHVYHAPQLIKETFRILKKNGAVVGIVPFLFPIHPSPQDFYRFTDAALQRMFTEAGFSSVTITPVAPGIMKARHVMIGRHLPGPVSAILELPLSWIASQLDNALVLLSKYSGKKYSPEHYPLGYLIEAKK